MKTDFGPHPADYYAGVAAAEIIQIQASAAGADAVQGRKLENEIIDILESAHQSVIDKEDAASASDEGHILTHLDATKHGLDDVVDQIVAAGKASKWGDHFKNPQVKAVIRHVVEKHLNTAAHVTRSWHVTNNPEHPNAKKFAAHWTRSGS